MGLAPAGVKERRSCRAFDSKSESLFAACEGDW